MAEDGEVDLNGDPRVTDQRGDIGCNEVPDADVDGDRVIDNLNECDNTPNGIPVNEQGRPVANID